MEEKTQRLEIVGGGRPRGVTEEAIADRAMRIRRHLNNGLGRREICLREHLTLGEFRSAMCWLGIAVEHQMKFACAVSLVAI